MGVVWCGILCFNSRLWCVGGIGTLLTGITF